MHEIHPILKTSKSQSKKHLIFDKTLGRKVLTMGYTSNVYTRGESTISARMPEFTQDELVARELFAAEAKARGFEVKDTKVPEVFKLVEGYLKANKDNFGWWFYVKETDDPNLIILESAGESGKAYELDQEINDFLKFLDENDLSLNVRIYREGEESGDVTRYIIEDSILISSDDAELLFPDGKGVE
jgi:hypothetical protein